MPAKPDHDDHRDISEHRRDDYDEILKCIFNELHGTRREAESANVYLCKMHQDFRDLLRFLECTKQKPKVRFWILTEGQDEPIPKAAHMKLSKPIKPGFRRPITITPDEDVDVNNSGTFLAIENVTGDSTTTVDPASTAKSLKFYINGDGSTGDKAIRVSADGHIGDGDQPVTLDIEFTVATPDATSLANLVEGVDEPIPA